MTDTTKKSRLPPESEDKVIEVSLKHVILGFTVVVTSAFVVGTGVVLLRDYVRYRRQKAIVDNFARLISLIPLKEKGGVLEEQSKN